ncbi:MAG TPA: gluconokinase, GntK/IdnK-type [Gemmatimonadaceae bacterium]|nr:gluconokinase, GntK/IdnK-type [Gemmatimonadaceae bacterium]
MSNEGKTAVRVIIVMGVAGAGKTLIGKALARALEWPFYDADDFHSRDNVEKMRRGEGLTDEDRRPWLAAMRGLIAGILERGERGILACSALKQSYRIVLVPEDAPDGTVRFVYLNVPEQVLRERLATRTHHFAPPALLPSQLQTLEEPADALWQDGTMPPDEIVRSIRAAFGI